MTDLIVWPGKERKPSGQQGQETVRAKAAQLQRSIAFQPLTGRLLKVRGLIVGNAFESLKSVRSALSASEIGWKPVLEYDNCRVGFISALTAIGVDARKRGDQ